MWVGSIGEIHEQKNTAHMLQACSLGSSHFTQMRFTASSTEASALSSQPSTLVSRQTLEPLTSPAATHQSPEKVQGVGIRKVDLRLTGKGNTDFHSARPVHLIITTMKWIWTSRLSTDNAFSWGVGGLQKHGRGDHGSDAKTDPIQNTLVGAAGVPR